MNYLMLMYADLVQRNREMNEEEEEEIEDPIERARMDLLKIRNGASGEILSMGTCSIVHNLPDCLKNKKD